MRQPQVDDRVRLTCNIPELSLNRGDVGWERSNWFAPNGAFEVEFQRPASCEHIRTLIMLPRIEALDAAEFTENVTELARQ